MWVRIRPGDAPASQPTERSALRRLLGIGPLLVLFGVLMGGIYGGLFTPTEGAAVGAGAAIVIAAVTRRLSWNDLMTALRQTVEQSVVIYLIIIGTAFFQFFMEASRVPVELAGTVTSLGLNPTAAMAGIMIFLALLGCVMEGLGIMFLTVPVLFPVVTALGFNPVWFGIMMVLLVELGLITPPVGLNIFVLVSLVDRLNLRDAFAGVLPFVVAVIVVAVLLLVLPGIALFLPSMM